MIEINQCIKDSPQAIRLGIITASVSVMPSSELLKEALLDVVRQVEALTLENYKNAVLEDARKAYRSFKKDPSRYWISSDSLLRRIIKQKGIYYVNNIVDINNLMSLKSYWSIGAYDRDKIVGHVEYTLGSGEDIYEGIGRGRLNIEHLPVLKDNLGPFGSATSDSLRTMVTDQTKEVMLVIHAFGNSGDLQACLDELGRLLLVYSNGTNISTMIINEGE